LFFSRAGGENAGSGFQINPKYGQLEFNDAYSEEKFSPVWSLIQNPDVQGGLGRVRKDSTLNHFTAANGQSIFRGDRLPKDLVGDYIINEPVARIIRRAKVISREGKTYLESAYEDSQEFIASTDTYFRPVNTYTGPDGCLYIVDMARGIIQESNWTQKGSYLREKIDYYGLGKINQRGRIWRLVHDDYKPSIMPKMLDVPARNLVTYLDSPNGWWRENAQKQIIILGDKSVVPMLETMVADQIRTSGLGRLHSLWTLEGLNAINKKLLLTALKDSDPQMRRAAIWISERYIKQNDKQWITNLGRLENDENFDVKTQLLLSLGASKNEFAQTIVQDILNKNPDNQMLASVSKSITKNEDAKIYGMKLAGFTPPQRKLISDGGEIYKAMCSACHGGDGKGLPTNAAPALYRAKHINADKEIAIRILLHGLKGPIEGKAYPSEMASMQDNTDEWIASVISYIRYEFAGTSIRIPNGGRQTAVVIPEEVRALRVKYSDVNEAWTIGAFDDFFSKTTNN